MSHPLQNWKCKCGRGPSIEHSVGGYCAALVVIESLESQRDALAAEVEKLKEQCETLNKLYQTSLETNTR